MNGLNEGNPFNVRLRAFLLILFRLMMPRKSLIQLNLLRPIKVL